MNKDKSKNKDKTHNRLLLLALIIVIILLIVSRCSDKGGELGDNSTDSEYEDSEKTTDEKFIGGDASIDYSGSTRFVGYNNIVITSEKREVKLKNYSVNTADLTYTVYDENKNILFDTGKFAPGTGDDFDFYEVLSDGVHNLMFDIRQFDIVSGIEGPNCPLPVKVTVNK